MVLQGSKELYNEVFEKFDHQKGDGWTDVDVRPFRSRLSHLSNFIADSSRPLLPQSYHHTPEMLDWLVNEKGCVWHKVCANAGDLILWDSVRFFSVFLLFSKFLRSSR